MRIAIIESGVVSTIVESTLENEEQFHSVCVGLPENSPVSAGWLWDGAHFTTPPLSLDQRKKNLIDAIQKHLDALALSMAYDGILSMASYAPSTSAKFGPEGRAASKWRDECWEEGYFILGEVLAGRMAEPTPAEIVAMLPPFALE